MIVVKEEGSRPIKAWVDGKQDIRWGDTCISPNIEDSAMQQLKNTAKLPFIHPNGIAVMPDVHFGIGATIGSVIATMGAIVPAAVGVDIGCGVNAVRTDLTIADVIPVRAGSVTDTTLSRIRTMIEKAVPTGRGEHEHIQPTFDPLADKFANSEALSVFRGDLRAIIKAGRQLGSLGGGNHFIELCLDEADRVWIMLHSGSRGIGNMIGRHFIDLAKRDMEKYFIVLPDENLAYLPEGSENFSNYADAVTWAQDYAMENRRAMMRAVHRVLCSFFRREIKFTNEAVNCHHNYLSRENHFGQNLWVTRKGAIRARDGDLGIIPGSMGARSFIVRGKGNPESYSSCSHGAGRVMGRKEAARRFTIDDLIAQTQGVECRKDAAVIDEIPAAYKSIDLVMANQTDLVEIVHTLKQVLCVKGA